MPTYLVESFLAGLRAAELDPATRRLRAAALAHSRAGAGAPVRHQRSVFVAEQEICLHFFEAGSADAVRRACRTAGLEIDRITQATGAHGAPTHEETEQS